MWSICLITLCTGKGRWVRSSSCITSGSTSSCRSAGSGCRWGSRTSTPLRPGGPAAGSWAGSGGGCVPRIYRTWHQRRFSMLWTSWKSSSSRSTRDFCFIWFLTTFTPFFELLFYVLLFFYLIWNVKSRRLLLFRMHFCCIYCSLLHYLFAFYFWTGYLWNW